MKLAIKLISVFIIVIVLLLASDGYLTVRQEIETYESDMKRDQHVFGKAMAGLIADAWKTTGQERALELLKDANSGENHIRLRWVWLDERNDKGFSPHIPSAQLLPVIAMHVASFKANDEHGQGFLYTYVHLGMEGRRGALELSEALSDMERYSRRIIFQRFVLLFVLMALTGGGAVLFGMRMVGRPLNRLIDKVRRVGAGDLAGPVNLHNHDELSELAAALNIMCDQLADARKKVQIETAARIDALEQLRHTDRLRIIGGLASGIAHELGTPLNVVSGRAGLIAKGQLKAEDVTDNANIIKAQSERMANIIQQLLSFARRRTPQKELVDLRQIVSQTIDFMAPLGHKRNSRLFFKPDDLPAMSHVDRTQIQQVLMNLVVNAFQSMPQGGDVEVAVRYERAAHPEKDKTCEKEYVCIDVLDEGDGISEDVFSRLFEPFFTTKKTGEGTGLGLSIAYDIIQEHGGWIHVAARPQKGSRFSVYLPREENI